MYNQAVGRFASEDILKGDVHSPLSLNNYTYCWNQPLDFVDLDGLCRECARRYMARYGPNGRRNPDYPNYGSNCANFVSQVLVAGGVEQIPGRWFIRPVSPPCPLYTECTYSPTCHNIRPQFTCNGSTKTWLRLLL